MLTPWKESYDQPAAAAAKSPQSCPTLNDPMDCSPPGSSTHGIFQARVLTNLDSILKHRDIILPTKVCLVKDMVFPVCMDMRVGLSAKELMLLNCGVGEDS